jgi:hypothetical protein
VPSNLARWPNALGLFHSADCAYILILCTDRPLCRNFSGDRPLWSADSRQRLLVKSGQRDCQTACPKLDVEIANAFDMPASAMRNPDRKGVWFLMTRSRHWGLLPQSGHRSVLEQRKRDPATGRLVAHFQSARNRSGHSTIIQLRTETNVQTAMRQSRL